jgi:hypothetical protein
MPRQPVTFDTVRELAQSLPGVEDSTAYGSPALKLRGKLLTCLPSNKSAEPNSLMVCLDFDQRDALLAEAPETYYLPGHYRSYPSVLVRLSKINPAQLRDLLHSAHRFVTAQTNRKPSRRTNTNRPGKTKSVN